MKKILKKISLFAVFTFIFVLIEGCASSNSIVGTWEYQNSSDTYYTFNRNSTGYYNYRGTILNFTYEDRGNKVIITYDGNTSSNEFDYSINDEILTIKDSFGNDMIYKRK